MLVLVIILIATNLATLGVLAWFALRPADQPGPDAGVARSLDATPARPGVSSSSPRRVITIEILNPVELAATRGRWIGIAGSFAPAITRRLVYDQALKMVRRQLAAERVVADVRLHVVTPAPPPPAPVPPVLPAPPLPADPGPQ